MVAIKNAVLVMRDHLIPEAVLFIEDGRVAAFGKHVELYENCAAYRKMVDLQKLEDEFDSKIGIPNANTQKRERLITAEVEANNTETEILADTWLENLQQGVEQTRELFGLTDLSVSLRYPRQEGGNTDATGRENQLSRAGELEQ